MSSYFSKKFVGTKDTLLDMYARLTDEDGDTEDDSMHMRVLRKYYLTEERPLPSFIPPDPRAPVKATPMQMVSSNGISQSSYGRPELKQADTAASSLRGSNSLRATNSSTSTGYTPSATPSIVDSYNRTPQPVVSARPAAPATQRDALKNRFGVKRTASPAQTQSAASSPGLSSLRASNPYEKSLGEREDNRPATGGGYTRNQYSGREAAAPAAPAAPSMSSNSPWAGGGDEYNGFSSYGSSSPFANAGNKRTGQVRGPRGM